MKTLQNINPAILDTYRMRQEFGAEVAEKLFGSMGNVNYDLELEISSVEEFTEFNLAMYAESSVERVANRIQEDAVVFKLEEVVNYGKEDFTGKKFFVLRKFGDNYFFNELSVSACIHSRGFLPVSIVRTGEYEYKVKFLTQALGTGKRIKKDDAGREFIKTTGRYTIFTDM